MRRDLAVKADVLVDVVRHHQHVGMPGQHVGEGAVLRDGVAGARWIAGRIDQQPARLSGDGGLELGGRDLEAVLLRASNGHGDALAGENHVRIGDPVGGRNDHLVAGLQRGLERAVDGALRAIGDDDVSRAVGETVLAVQLGGNGLPQFGRPGQHGVAGRARLDGPGGGGADVRRGVEIGLADDQADDAASLALQGAGAVGGGGAGGGLDAPDAFGNSGALHGDGS